MSDASRRGRRNRQRGQEGERELASLLSAEFGCTIKRTLGQERDSGSDVRLPGFIVEVKRRKGVALLYEAMAQAESARQPIKHPQLRQMPCVAVRADGEGWLIVMRLPDWCRIAREEVAACSLPMEET